MSEVIRHHGKVTGVTPRAVTVRIEDGENDCSGCAISNVCGKGESLTIPYTGATDTMIGKQVDVEISPRSQLRAILMLMILPLITLVLFLFIGVGLGLSETGALAISTVVTLPVVLVGVRYVRTKASGTIMRIIT